MSEIKPLLTVEDHFLLEGRGLVVVPLLELPPENRRFKPFSCEATVRRPDGTEHVLTVKFAVEHFRLIDGGSKWSITPLLPDATKETVPIGSQLFIDEDVRRKLNGEVSTPREE